MPTLHLVSRAPALAACLEVAGADDAVLLLEDGVYAGVAAGHAADHGENAPARSLFALEPDVRARGLGGRLGAGITVVSDAGFVDLVERHQPIVTWR